LGDVRFHRVLGDDLVEASGLAVVRRSKNAAEPLGILAFRSTPREDDADVRRRDVDPLVEDLRRDEQRVFARAEPLQDLGAFVGLGLVGNAGDDELDDELLEDVVGEIIVGGE
jgi:hypothetical protein